MFCILTVPVPSLAERGGRATIVVLVITQCHYTANNTTSTYRLKRIRTDKQANIHSYVNAYTPTYKYFMYRTHICLHIYIHTYTYMYIIYMYMYIYTYSMQTSTYILYSNRLQWSLWPTTTRWPRWEERSRYTLINIMIETSYTKVCSVRSERELPDQNDSKCLNSIWKW